MSAPLVTFGPATPRDPHHPADPDPDPDPDANANANANANADANADADANANAGTLNSATTIPAPARTDLPSQSSMLPGEQLFLHRDLNEVLLLMDFISGRRDVHIWDIGDIRYP
ncbi:hypothetical protein, partial [Caballeronia terrestris]|uniref:hypothetical protein n=1 Tax=Caballeronia terrestris TaxID=1226301 RepID=UPI000A76ADBB